MEFSFGGGKDEEEGSDELIITNQKAVKVKYKIEAAPSTQCVIKANPDTGSIAPGKDKKVKLKAEVKEKVNLTFKLTVHVGEATHFINVRVRSVTGVFGTDPTTLDLIEDEELMVPEVLVLMKKSLIANEGLKTEGIFRLAGDVSDIAYLKDQMNRKLFQKSDNVNTVATLIKVWFRELPDPILNKVPQESIFYSSDPEKCINAYRDMVEPSKTLLTWLLDLLCMTTAHSGVNRMTPQNLAIVVAPNLYDSSSSDPMEGLVMSQKCVQFLNNVLLWYLERKTGSVPEHKPAPAIPIRSADDTAVNATSSSPTSETSSTTANTSSDAATEGSGSQKDLNRAKSPGGKRRALTRNQTEGSPSGRDGSPGRSGSVRAPGSPSSAKKKSISSSSKEGSSSSIGGSAPTKSLNSSTSDVSPPLSSSASDIKPEESEGGAGSTADTRKASISKIAPPMPVVPSPSSSPRAGAESPTGPRRTGSMSALHAPSIPRSSSTGTKVAPVISATPPPMPKVPLQLSGISSASASNHTEAESSSHGRSASASVSSADASPSKPRGVLSPRSGGGLSSARAGVEGPAQRNYSFSISSPRSASPSSPRDHSSNDHSISNKSVSHPVITRVSNSEEASSPSKDSSASTTPRLNN